MIISDKYKLAFVHIPKCGGTTVKLSMAALDDRGGLYSKVQIHPELGRMDYTHIPLRIMKRYFAEDFECVRTYRSYALCREPMDRFLSAVLQRIMVYDQARRRETLPRDALRAEIERVIGYLSEHDTIDNHRFIHFEKQCSFLFSDSEQVVDRIFRLCDMDRMFEEIAACTNLQIGRQAALNQSLYARNVAARFLVEKVWPIGRRLLPHRLAATRHRLKSYLFVPARQRLGDVLESSEAREFIERYYACDLELFHSLGPR